MPTLTEEYEAHLKTEPKRPSPIPQVGTKAWDDWYKPFLIWTEKKRTLMYQLEMGHRMKARR